MVNGVYVSVFDIGKKKRRLSILKKVKKLLNITRNKY